MANYLLSHTGAQIDEGIDAALNIDSTLADAMLNINNTVANRIGSTGPAGCRNKFHNPLFSAAQRGGSGTVANGQSNWLFDRWRTQIVNLSGCSLTVSASSMVIGGKTRRSMKVANVASATSLPADSFVNPFTQGIEGRELVDMLGDSATIRCYIRASVAGNYNVSLSVRNAAGTTIKCFNTRVSIPANTITPIEFTLPTDAANWVCEDSANVGAYLSFCAIGGSNYQASTVDAWVSGNTPLSTGPTNWLATAGATVELCMPQLVRGTVAGEFDCLDYSLEIQRCQYYYNKLTALNYLTYQAAASGFRQTISFPRMRGVPTPVTSNISYVNSSTAAIPGVTASSLQFGATAGNTGATAVTMDVELTGLEI